MPFSMDPQGRGNRAQALALLALRTQVRILSTHWPMRSWAVFDRTQAVEARPLAAQGPLRAVARQILDPWMAASPGHALPGLHGALLHRVAARAEDPTWPRFPAATHVIRLPLRVPGRSRPNGVLVGVLAAAAAPPHPAERLTSLSWSLEAMALALAQWEESGELTTLVHSVRQEACLDHLTGVLNRRGWDICVQRLEGNDGPERAVIMLDLDELKHVNDRHGHASGDALLQQTAQVLRHVLRTDDVIARLGGDEFGMLLARGVTQDSLQRFVTRVRQALSEARIQVSLGVALRSEAGSVQEALALADRRMYQDKETHLGKSLRSVGR
ncbi:MAG TPA: GGDEF domain-containing protein [Castellaniella sp.]|nr:GGDEF domain-containing protein [Castellaniella sp.]